jgi:hypothetical protein
MRRNLGASTGLGDAMKKIRVNDMIVWAFIAYCLFKAVTVTP